MTKLRTLALCALVFLPVLSLAQIQREFAGKWVVDGERMSEVEPAWDGVVTDEMWIVTGFREGKFFVSRGPAGIETYDPSGGATTVSLGEDEAIATAQWEGARLVVQMNVPADGRSFSRTIYREGHWLVMEDEGRSDARWKRTFFVKT